jgi:AcrR family transcriptional regulator
MTAKNRREREKEEMKKLILTTAGDIAASEGFENLSIRKIANRIEYSPSIIYHYFSDKDDIINNLMKNGYKKIVEAISSAGLENCSPEDRLKQMTRNYIETALKMPDEFMAAQLNKSEKALIHTASLFRGASKKKSALAALFQCIKEINKDIETDESKIEIKSQIIVVSSLGLILKLIVEKDLGDSQKQRLIEYFCNEAVLKIAKEC